MTSIDDETGKSREIDITAILGLHIGDKKDPNFIFVRLLIECENNKQPIVFFRNDSPMKDFFILILSSLGNPSRIYETKEFQLELTKSKKEIINILRG